MPTYFVFVLTIISFTSAAVLPIELELPDEAVLHRQRRGDPPQWFGGGGADKHLQHGTIGLQYPNGAGGQLSYGHATGYGHDLSVDAKVPVWQRQSRYGGSTLNLGGGVSQHFGGYSGSHMTDKRIGLSFIHRF